MNAKKLSWAFGLALLVVVGGIGWAICTDRLAVVSKTTFTSLAGGVECHLVKYTSLGTELEIFTGHSSNAPLGIVDGAFIYTRVKYLGNPSTSPWKDGYYGDQSKGMTTYACLHRK